MYSIPIVKKEAINLKVSGNTYKENLEEGKGEIFAI